jgi:hypothetical protein
MKSRRENLTVSGRRIAALLVLALGSAAPGVGAHSNEYLATIKGAHGGQIRMAEMYHFEVVVANGELQVWVTDHGNQAIPTEGASGSAVILAGTAKLNVDLAPAGENRLRAKDKRIVAASNGRIALTVSMKGQRALQVRFAPVEQAAEQHAGHAAH